ncbi:MAG: DEAD/DEAH box helicase family protein [Anaerolineales bacterium]|nr:DEAD/DEAH box helicase family protein [Anaerolineales bacterium]
MTVRTPDETFDLEQFLEQLPLWEPQRASVECMRNYIWAYQGGEVTESAMVHMPTGSGKTGVIATLARFLEEVGCVLVLTPRVALREQLFRDIDHRFYEHLDPSPDIEKLPKDVVQVKSRERVLDLENIDATVLISTIQMISNMSKDTRNGKEWDTLLAHVSLVIIDEGHCEPASFWSTCIRSFKTPKIIFTATPFRNDLKYFDINTDYLYSYTFHHALEDRILREVDFIEMKRTKDPEKFIDQLLDFYDRKFRGEEENQVRVIIRCDSREEIRQIKHILVERRRSCIAIHETFTDDDDGYERRQVPEISKEKDIEATFWIHQFKLQEGIDDSRFQVLAPFDPIRDGRALIQQIGRIIRNPTRDPDAKGYVLDFSGGQQQDIWRGFVNYDKALTRYGIKAFKMATGSGWLTELFEAQPLLTYIEHRFRRPVDIEKINPGTDLDLPRMVNLRYVERGFRLANLCAHLEKEFKDNDRTFSRYEVGEAIIYVYVTINNSPLLTRHYFLEPKLGVTYLRLMKKPAAGNEKQILAFYDSSGHLPIRYDEVRLGSAVESIRLKRLFSNDYRSCLTNVSLRNSNLGTIAIRARTISAADIYDTVSAFDDHAQICSNVTGYSWEQEDFEKTGRSLRRYLGFQRGRISEASERCGLSGYESWLSTVAGTIRAPRNLLPAFRRYAIDAADVADGTPRHILLDLLEVQDFFETVGKKKEPMMIQDVSCEVTKGSFEVIANRKKCKVHVGYDKKRRRYHLDSKDIDELYRNIRENDDRGLITYLNQEQSFRIIPNTEEVIYTMGEFYQPMFKVGKSFDPHLFEVSQVLVPAPILAEVASEKGEPPDPSGWARDTLFGVIDNLGKPFKEEDQLKFETIDNQGNKAFLHEYFGEPDIVVCDDMGTEAADFILADSQKRRVVFIHAKGNPKLKPASASALQDVVGQATKNINFLGMFNETLPKNLGRWDEPWMGPKGTCVNKRIRAGAATGKETWEQIQKIIHHPLADREVWLFMGKTLSKSRFEELLKMSPPGAEALQGAYLLFATMTNVASVGAKLRVFCYP